MTEYETVKYAQDDAVAVITIHRPDAMNSFNDELRRDLLAACDRAAGDDSVRAVVITGEGRTFSAGADLKGSLDPDKSIEDMLQAEYRPVLSPLQPWKSP